MTLQGYTHRQIIAILQITSGFISKWKKKYLEHGIEGLKLQHKGAKGYLGRQARAEVIKWR